MTPRTYKQGSRIIVYDADLIQQPTAQLFTADARELGDRLVGRAAGRGSALLLETAFGPAVLRHYLRGGWAAHLSRDYYLYTGHQRSRPIAEFHMLASLSELGLPVPRPLAAQCRRKALFYSGDLLTARLLNVIPLADLPDSRWADPETWLATGACIRRFHDRGVIHADLNARNILISGNNSVYLIDFDRARIRQGAWALFDANLKRLRRSLQKIHDHRPLEQSWRYLQRGYRQGPAGQPPAGQESRGQHHPGPY